MSDFTKFIIGFFIIGGGSSILIIFVYWVICLINKRYNLDMNGNPVKKVEYVQQPSQPQVIKIDLSGLEGIKKIDTVNNEPERKAIEEKKIDRTMLLDDATKKFEVETSFKGKRIGQVK